MNNLNLEINYLAHMLDDAMEDKCNIVEKKGQQADTNGTNVQDTNIAPNNKDYKTFKNVLTKVRDDNYEGFVKSLQDLGNDEKLKKVAQAFKKYFDKGGIPDQERGEINYGSQAIPIKNIHPTQYEIDIDKSLKYPLSHPDDITKFLTSTEGIKCGPNPIVVALIDNVYYVIDGHHRWSQVYMINPHAKMETFVIQAKKFFNNPDDILKLLQSEILKKTGEIKIQTVDGKNMLEISDDEIRNYILKFKNNKKLISVLNDNGFDSIEKFSDLVVKNKNIMKKYAPETETAHNRGVMPQCPNGVDMDNLISTKTPPKLSESIKNKYSKKQIINTINYWSKKLKGLK